MEDCELHGPELLVDLRQSYHTKWFAEKSRCMLRCVKLFTSQLFIEALLNFTFSFIFPEVQENHLWHPIPLLLYEPLLRYLRCKKILRSKIQYFVPCTLPKSLVSVSFYMTMICNIVMMIVHYVIICKEKGELIANIRIWEYRSIILKVNSSNTKLNLCTSCWC